ncbi:Hypothetical Protein RradSPS_3157 (plasmid) [Rubrobacter radiotolerans]|uniref:Uncharacterized protein n=1 Tax=Rubrobacter radiotolerans TaxID=42256 RepID=A0A023X8U0_RUBRA|nr:Hypothetical Protein RradSPS_3157 [Rubrobacter radiotolerans]
MKKSCLKPSLLWYGKVWRVKPLRPLGSLIGLGEGGDLMARSKSSGGSSKGSYRSAISGRYVTAKHGKSSPRTTVKESRKSK